MPQQKNEAKEYEREIWSEKTVNIAMSLILKEMMFKKSSLLERGDTHRQTHKHTLKRDHKTDARKHTHLHACALVPKEVIIDHHSLYMSVHRQVLTDFSDLPPDGTTLTRHFTFDRSPSFHSRFLSHILFLRFVVVVFFLCLILLPTYAVIMSCTHDEATHTHTHTSS